MIYALCRKIDFVENLRVFGVKIWTGISIRVKNLTFSMSGDVLQFTAQFNSSNVARMELQSTKHFRVGVPEPSLSAWSCLTSAT